MTDAEKVKLLRAALLNSGCNYSRLVTWGWQPEHNLEAIKNPQTRERHNMWCDRCAALDMTAEVPPDQQEIAGTIINVRMAP